MKYLRALRNNGRFARGEARQSARPAALRPPDGRPSVTDGPYAETKEVLGGLFVGEAEDADHAVSKPPGARPGAFDLRPIDEELTVRVSAGDR
jgi:hypothetical protein